MGQRVALCTYFPLLQLVLFRLVLLDKVIEHLLQAIRIGFQGRNDILDSSFHQNAIYQAEALAAPGSGSRVSRTSLFRSARMSGVSGMRSGDVVAGET